MGRNEERVREQQRRKEAQRATQDERAKLGSRPPSQSCNEAGARVRSRPSPVPQQPP